MTRRTPAALTAMVVLGVGCSSSATDAPARSGGSVAPEASTSRNDQGSDSSTPAVDPAELTPERLDQLEQQLDEAERRLDELEQRTPARRG